MNQEPENDTDAIRSEIDTTRRRMDDTMEALGERLKGRHLFDELLGLFRSDNQTPKAMEIREKVSRTASTAARSVVDTVKSNPMPAVLIGAGIAWMIYASRKSANASYDEDAGLLESYDPDASYDRPLEYPSPESTRGFAEDDEGFSLRGSGDFEESGESKFEAAKSGLQEKAVAAKDQVKQKLANASNQVREKAQMARERMRDAGSRVQARTREVYVQARERVVTTADQHPLEVGLACLAAGVAVGLALPTPEKLNQVAGPTMDRLRRRTRDASGEIVQKGKRVVDAASTAFKNEAQQQGLTFDALRQKAGAVADRTKEAAQDAAQQEGVSSGGLGSETSQRGPSGGSSENIPAGSANAGRGI